MGFDVKLIGDGEGVVFGFEEVNEADGFFGGFAGNVAAIVAPQQVCPLLVVGDDEHILVGGTGDFFGDVVDALDGTNEDVAQDDLVEGISSRLVLLGW